MGAEEGKKISPEEEAAWDYLIDQMTAWCIASSNFREYMISNKQENEQAENSEFNAHKMTLKSAINKLERSFHKLWQIIKKENTIPKNEAKTLMKKGKEQFSNLYNALQKENYIFSEQIKNIENSDVFSLIESLRDLKIKIEELGTPKNDKAKRNLDELLGNFDYYIDSFSEFKGLVDKVVNFFKERNKKAGEIALEIKNLQSDQEKLERAKKEKIRSLYTEGKEHSFEFDLCSHTLKETIKDSNDLLKRSQIDPNRDLKKESIENIIKDFAKKIDKTWFLKTDRETKAKQLINTIDLQTKQK
jgi:hypothetical protein